MLCTHTGFNFDFKILIKNMQKYEIPLKQLGSAKLHFADTFEFCKEVSFLYVNTALMYFSFYDFNPKIKHFGSFPAAISSDFLVLLRFAKIFSYPVNFLLSSGFPKIS